MRYIDKSFIEYETQVAFDLQRQKAEALESIRYLTEIRDEHERLGDLHGVQHYNVAIKAHEDFIHC